MDDTLDQRMRGLSDTHPLLKWGAALVIGGLMAGIQFVPIIPSLAAWLFLLPVMALIGYISLKSGLGGVCAAATAESFCGSAIVNLLAIVVSGVVIVYFADRYASLRKKCECRRLLLDEREHRSKNELQRLVASFLSYAKEAKSPEASEAFRHAADKVLVVGKIRELLSWRNMNGIDVVNINAFMADLVSNIRKIAPANVRIDLKMKGTLTMTATKASIVAMALSELLTNAFKYAFPQGQDGHIAIDLAPDGSTQWVLRVQDNGVGLQADSNAGRGHQIVRALISQMNGEIKASSTSGGTIFEIVFPTEPVDGDTTNPLVLRHCRV